MEKISNTNEKLYSIEDIHNVIKFMNKNYSNIEDELARPYEDSGEILPDDFFENAYNECFKRAVDSID
jgi:hypothetical protein